MRRPTYDALARRFVSKRRIDVDPWPSGFLTGTHKGALRAALRGRPRQTIEKFIDHLDGECVFYTGTIPQWSEAEHRERLRRIVNAIYDAEDALDELRKIGLRRRFRFADTLEPKGSAIDRANDELKHPVWVAKLSLGDVTNAIRRELSPCWPPHGRHITYVPPLKPVSRKGGRPRAKDSRFVELLVEVARAFHVAFGEKASTSKTGPFADIASILAGALRISGGRDASRSVAAAIKQVRAADETSPRT